MTSASLVILLPTALCAACAGTASMFPGLRETSALAPACVGAAPLDTTVHDTTEITSKPLLRAYPELHYPDRARREKLTGSVVVFFVVGADGVPEASSIRPIGGFDPELNDEAGRFVTTARYWPGCLEGRPVRVRTKQRVDFRIVQG